MTATGGTFTYDGTTHTGGSAVVTGAGIVTGSAVLSYTGDQVNAGSYTVTATYAGDANHTGSSDTRTITIDKGSTRPSIGVTRPASPMARPWTALNSMPQWRALQATNQLALTYSPAASTVLNAGGGHSLIVSTAATTNYYAASKTVHIDVARATLTVKADNKSRNYMVSNPPLTATYSGFVNSETLATSDVSGSPILSTTATISSPVGSYPITIGLGTLASANYAFASLPGILTVVLPWSVFVLDPIAVGALTLSGNAKIDLSTFGGNVIVNSSSSTAIMASGNAQVKATGIQVHGGVQKSGNASFSPGPGPPRRRRGSAPGLAAPTAAPPDRGEPQRQQLPDHQPRHLQLDQGSGNGRLTMNPGVYVIAGGGFSVSGNGSVTGTGVMIYNAGSNYPSAAAAPSAASR